MKHQIKAKNTIVQEKLLLFTKKGNTHPISLANGKSWLDQGVWWGYRLDIYGYQHGISLCPLFHNDFSENESGYLCARYWNTALDFWHVSSICACIHISTTHQTCDIMLNRSEPIYIMCVQTIVSALYCNGLIRSTPPLSLSLPSGTLGAMVSYPNDTHIVRFIFYFFQTILDGDTSSIKVVVLGTI